MNTHPTNNTPRPPLSLCVLTAAQLHAIPPAEARRISQAVREKKRMWRHWYDPKAGPPPPGAQPDGDFAAYAGEYTARSAPPAPPESMPAPQADQPLSTTPTTPEPSTPFDV